MFNKKLSDGVYNVGVLNPNMRVFDVIMETKNGTSYNSYLVRGSEKTALIECVHRDYYGYLKENINSICGCDSMDGVKIDYLIMNHNEPDHSGGISRLLEDYPEIQVIATQPGANFLKNIVNRADMNVRVVKDGDMLELGGKTLEFISAPFLHWPDSMFTYLREDRVLFSCDFLGAHFCEPGMLDSDVLYADAYEEAVRVYYDAIFSPFKKHVRYGLEKIAPLDILTCAPSHGPMLTKGIELDKVIALYTQWSAEQVRDTKSIPIFYCSAYGNTGALAESIAEGIKSVVPSADVPLFNIIEHDIGELGGLMNGSDAFLVGSPTINRDAVPPVYILLAHLDAVNIAGRPVGLFGSFGWSGEAVANIKGRLDSVRAKVFDEMLKINFIPTGADLERAKEFGAEFARSL